jgi:hypothetical protein
MTVNNPFDEQYKDLPDMPGYGLLHVSYLSMDSSKSISASFLDDQPCAIYDRVLRITSKRDLRVTISAEIPEIGATWPGTQLNATYLHGTVLQALEASRTTMSGTGAR